MKIVYPLCREDRACPKGRRKRIQSLANWCTSHRGSRDYHRRQIFHKPFHCTWNPKKIQNKQKKETKMQISSKNIDFSFNDQKFALTRLYICNKLVHRYRDTSRNFDKDSANTEKTCIPRFDKFPSNREQSDEANCSLWEDSCNRWIPWLSEENSGKMLAEFHRDGFLLDEEYSRETTIFARHSWPS